MNILISATTATQLTVCLIFLLLILALEVFAFVGLFMWRKKALQPKKHSANSTVTQQTASSDQETRNESALTESEQTGEPQVESQTSQESVVAEEIQPVQSGNEQSEQQINLSKRTKSRKIRRRLHLSLRLLYYRRLQAFPL